jgi:CBS domain-containing membrane protein
MLTVAEIMTRQPFTLGPDDTVESARQMMAQHHIRHIPVVNDSGILVGLITQRDVLAAQDSTVLNPAADESSRDRYVAISAVMTTPVQTTDESASLRGTALHLLEHKLGCLPVVSDGKLVGIITDSDFVTVAINLMEQLELSEPEEVLFEED